MPSGLAIRTPLHITEMAALQEQRRLNQSRVEHLPQ